MSEVSVVWYGLIPRNVERREGKIHISGSTIVRELLQSLVKRHHGDDAFRANIFTSDSRLQSNVVIQLNGRDINEIDGLNTKLEDNSELTITVLPPLIAGG